MTSGTGLVRFDDATTDASDAGLPPDVVNLEFADPPWLFQPGDEDFLLSPGDDPVFVQIERPYDSTVFQLSGPDPGYTARLFLENPGTSDAVDRVLYSEWISDGSSITDSNLFLELSVADDDLLVQNGETSYMMVRRGDVSPSALGSFQVRYTQYGPAWPEITLGYGAVADPVGNGTVVSPELVSPGDTFEFTPPVGSDEYVLFLTSVSAGATLRVWLEDSTSPGAPSSHADVVARVEIERNNSGVFVDVTDQAQSVNGDATRNTPDGFRIDDPYAEPARLDLPPDTTLVRVHVGRYGGGTFEDPPGPEVEQTFRFAYDYE